jgi:putative tryptophan/tyrosine transport system substrate-binding protein
MSPVADPIGSGFVKSLARPGGNITGVSNMSADLTAKSLELLNLLVPNARRIAVLMSANPAHATQLQEAGVAARTLGLTLIPVTAAAPSDLSEAFQTMTRENCNGQPRSISPVARWM